MARQYYGTSQELYALFIRHPVMSQMLEEFEVDTNYDPNDPTDTIALRDVCEYLVTHEDDLLENPVSMYYNSGDMIEELAELYGFDSINYPPPYEQYTSTRGTKLSEFLNYTLYFYKFAVSDNFYEKNILDFIPEYDREQVKNNRKLQLTLESIGRKLDDVEDKITRLGNIYDVDEIPEELLDYLGQNLGYEREDFTLSGFSFRELLKNIIEIYKIKGTNHSFSFFFKFLGFEVSLKEFYFNRDAQNPESFPGVESVNVEYYLTTKNPIHDTTYNSPAKFLEPTRNLDDWDIEYNSLVANGCINPEGYMTGKESYNYDLITFHQNPWKYFKTNLIEYELNPFFDKLNLTASDNETIRKYIKFLSPTYLFTWINVNLRPWIEDAFIVTDSETDWRVQINKILGDPKPSENMNPWPPHPQGQMGVPENITGVFNRSTGSTPGFEPPYLDYEDVRDQIALYDPEGDMLVFNLTNNMNLGGDDVVGALLRRDGTHIRQQGHPKHISDARHRADKRVAFDNLALELKPDTLPDIPENWENYSLQSYPPVPDSHFPREGRTASESNIVDLEWEPSVASVGYRVQLSNHPRLFTIILDDDTLVTPQYTTGVLHNDKYYWRVKVKNNANYPDSDPERWTRWSSIWSFTLKTIPFPFDGEMITEETYYVNSNYAWNATFTGQQFMNANFNIEWEEQSNVRYYHCQVGTNPTLSTFEIEDRKLIRPQFNVSLENNTYYWRYRFKDRDTPEWDESDSAYSSWSPIYSFTINFPMNI